MDRADHRCGTVKVLVRLDDFTPNRHRERWSRVTNMLRGLGIRPLVAVVPADRYFGPGASDDAFWSDVRELETSGWHVGLHGETHEVEPIPGGADREIFFASKSEFVGLPLEAQLRKITVAWDTFARHGVHPQVFIAPNHGFDAQTVEAVRRHGKMRYISDGIALRPYSDRDLVWLPQIDWKVPVLRVGFRTVCLHPSTMDDREFARITRQLEAVHVNVLSVDELGGTAPRSLGPADRAFGFAFHGFFRARESLLALLRLLAGC
jgi:predicted deacetylase